MGSDLCEREQRIIELVSIHAPAWGATGFSSFFSWSLLFQPTLPHGERQSTRSPKTTSGWFQPTLPHGERLLTHDATLRAKIVSIHAPTWGATAWRSAFVERMMVSIHAPAWRATIRLGLQGESACFNPRSHTGSDTARLQYLSRVCRFQSTLPHGERRLQRLPYSHSSSFNPRSHTGSDQ